MQINQFLRRVSFAVPIVLVALVLASPMEAQADYYSAYYTLNSVTPSYIEASGLPFLSGDDEWSDVSLPFPFTFYGVTYGPGIVGRDKVYVSTNGYINFVGRVSGRAQYTNTCPLPSAGVPNGAIYAFWDDLHVDGLASMHTEVLGAAPNRQFIIEWRNVKFFGDSIRRLSFEIVLSETGEIALQYRDINNDFKERGGFATIGVETTDGLYAYQFSCNSDTMGSAEFPLGSTTFAIQYSHASTVAADIKPGGCPNPINVGSKGVLPVAILGTSSFDVMTIDPTTVRLAGVPALRSSLEDVGTPYMPLTGKTEANQCNALGADGYMDLTLKFDTQAVAAALGAVNDGDTLVLHLTGALKNGKSFSGEDVVTIIKKGK